MGDTEIYIKYLNYQAVGVKTHILNTNPVSWIQTLFKVGDLIAAYKIAVTPLLDQSSLAELTLHLPDGVAIPGNTLLTAIQQEVGSYEQPLIIKSKSDAGQGIVHGLTVGNEMGVDFLTFANQTVVPMTADYILGWLCGSNTNSTTDLKDHEILSQEEIDSNTHIVFPLAGREDSLEHIAACFLTSYQKRCNKDRNSRPIPVCTGIPGLGKTRLLDFLT